MARAVYSSDLVDDVDKRRATWRRRHFTQAGPLTVVQRDGAITTRPAYSVMEHNRVLAGPAGKVHASPVNRHSTRKRPGPRPGLSLAEVTAL